MNEFEWLYGGDPVEMLEFLRPQASKRKLQLFWCAYLRDQGKEEDAGMFERLVDGVATEADHIMGRSEEDRTTAEAWHRAAIICRMRDDAHPKRQRRCSWLRDLFGNPFQPRRLDGAWLRWNDGAVTRMAQAIYDEARFADVPILADALEEAGCDDAFLLHHCRAGGEHVRGCWAVDLLLGQG